jgi:magnesium-protoporphyrin O-methyltransferase
MQSTYLAKRARLENYFNEVSSDAWDKLTSNEPVSFVRQLVREGRQKMLLAILEKLPQDLKGSRILDAGCGTGVLSRMLDERGAEVVGVDISDKLIEVAKNRSRSHRNIEYFSGDMKEQSFGNFDYIIAMDSLIHYSTEDVISSIADFSNRANNSVLFTVIPSTFALRTKLRLGKYFPKSERSPEVVPIGWGQLHQLEAHGIKASLSKIKRIKSFFYVSEAWELANR